VTYLVAVTQYAKVSKERRFQFSNMIKYYLNKRENLTCLFVLIDLRIPPQAIDIAFINWAGENGIPFVMVGTKADKAGKKQVAETLENYKVALSEIWEELPTFYVSSSETKEGKSEILDFIQECMAQS
jgi:GTP-binding protein